VLRQTVDDLRGEMQRKGVIKAGPDGPKPKAAGAVAPDTVLDEEFPLKVTRSDGGTQVQTVGSPERRDGTECGWRVGLQHLEAISDFALGDDSLGRSSPIRASLAGLELSGHATPSDYEKSCGGAYRHQQKYLFYAPPAGASAPEDVQVRLDDAVPSSDEAGRPRYWIYPGTSLTIQATGTWNSDWGEPHVVYDLRLRDVGLASKPTARSAGAVTFTIPGRELSGREAVWRGSEPLQQTGPFELTISSPADGPFVLIEALAIGNAANAAVVTSKQNPGSL
jgi:hypothetical protein